MFVRCIWSEVTALCCARGSAPQQELLSPSAVAWHWPLHKCDKVNHSQHFHSAALPTWHFTVANKVPSWGHGAWYLLTCKKPEAKFSPLFYGSNFGVSCPGTQVGGPQSRRVTSVALSGTSTLLSRVIESAALGILPSKQVKSRLFHFFSDIGIVILCAESGNQHVFSFHFCYHRREMWNLETSCSVSVEAGCRPAEVSSSRLIRTEYGLSLSTWHLVGVSHTLSVYFYFIIVVSSHVMSEFLLLFINMCPARDCKRFSSYACICTARSSVSSYFKS
jgi:hypothetical protein